MQLTACILQVSALNYTKFNTLLENFNHWVNTAENEVVIRNGWLAVHVRSMQFSKQASCFISIKTIYNDNNQNQILYKILWDAKWRGW